MIWEETGERISILRKNKRLTKTQFGKMIGVSGQHIGRIERGINRVSVDMVADICKITGVSADYIIFGIANSVNDAMLNELSYDQIEIGLDILKRLAHMINTDNGNEKLINEVFRRQHTNINPLQA
jgi:transcriptional regulator with XRE-family HTH domain